jgi:glycerol-3-phosphate dehydrogenase
LRAVDVAHAIREEMAMGLADLVLRRLGLGYLGHPGIDVLRRCAEMAAPEFVWNAADVDREVAQLHDRLARYSFGTAVPRSIAP